MKRINNHVPYISFVHLMRIVFSVFTFCVLGLFGCGKQSTETKTDLIPQKNNTKKFFNQDGQFKVQFEDAPTAYSQYVPYESMSAQGGKILMNYFIYEKGINLIYCLSYADYPESFTNGKVPEDILNDLLDTYCNTQNTTPETKKMVSFNSFPGIYFKASNSDTFVFGEYVLRKNRLYQLTVTKEGGYHNEAESNPFLQSLELL